MPVLVGSDASTITVGMAPSASPIPRPVNADPAAICQISSCRKANCRKVTATSPNAVISVGR